MKPEIHNRFNQPLIPYLLGILALLQLVAPYQGWLVLLVGLGGGWLVSALWIRSLAQGLRLNRQTGAGWAQVGDRLEEQFVLSNDGWARGLAVEVIDQSSLPDYQAGRVVSVEGRTATHWSVSGDCTRRGLYTLGPTMLRVSDPLGMYSLTLTYPMTMSLMVTPRIVNLPTIEIAPGGHTDQGHRPLTTYEPLVNAAGVRDHFPGASLRMIHWPTTARRDALYVRLFDNNPAGDWWVFLDLDRQVQAGTGYRSTEEHAIILAASLADRGLKRGRAVGLVGQGQALVWLPPRHGDEQRWQILSKLALLTPGELSLAQLLDHAQSAFSRQASLIIITPNLNQDWLQAVLPLMSRGVLPTILLLDPASFAPAEYGQDRSEPLAESFIQFGITTYLITPDLLDLPPTAAAPPSLSDP